MPRYLVEHFIPRAGELTAMELKAIAEQCLLVQQELEEQILWLFSAITSDRMIGLFTADDETAVREHARRSGLPIERISEVTAIIGPTAGAFD